MKNIGTFRMTKLNIYFLCIVSALIYVYARFNVHSTALNFTHWHVCSSELNTICISPRINGLYGITTALILYLNEQVQQKVMSEIL